MAFDEATPEQIGVHVTFTGSAPSQNATATCRYRKPAGLWTDAHPLLRIQPSDIAGQSPVAVPDAFAGSIFDLEPGQEYDVEVSITDPSGPDQVLLETTTTRALPAAAGAATKTANPSNLQTQLDGLVAGDVLELEPGTYSPGPGNSYDLTASGTAQNPIYIRGRDDGRDRVIIDSGFVVLNADWIIVENVRILGVDLSINGLNGFVFWNNPPIGGGQTGITVRDVVFDGLDVCLWASAAVYSCLVYNCYLIGNNAWSEIIGPSTWDDDGIRLPGKGNVAFENTLIGFGDCFSVNDLAPQASADKEIAAIYFYRNKILMTGDDCCEMDYAHRNIAFYDNYVSNFRNFSQDPVWGGPSYWFRNIFVNPYGNPMKFNDDTTGVLVDQNTFVRTIGDHTTPWSQFSNDSHTKSWTFRNNIFVDVRSPAATTLFAHETSQNNPIDFGHNGWWPDAQFQWSQAGGLFANLAAAQSDIPDTTPVFSGWTKRHTNDVIGEVDPFEEAIPLQTAATPQPPTEITEVYIPRLKPGSAFKNAGIAIAGVNDGFSGASPDLGAVIEGRSLPQFGAKYLPQAMDTWKSLPNTNFTAQLPTGGPPPYGSDKTNGMISAWNGMGYDTRRQRLIIYGGGHTDYSGNEVYVFCLFTHKWTRLTDPSAPHVASESGNPDLRGRMPDGTPYSTHTAGHIEYMPEIDALGVFGRWGIFHSGVTGTLVFGDEGRDLFVFDFATNSWTVRSTQVPTHTIQPQAVHDPTRGLVWFHVMSDSTGQWESYDVDANTWTGPISTSQNNGEFGGNRYMILRNNGTVDRAYLLGDGDIYWKDLTNPASAWVQVSASGAIGILNNANFGAKGFAYQSSQDRIVGYHEGSDVFLIDPDTGVITQRTLGGDLPPTPNNAGTTSRFRYLPDWDAFVMVYASDENVHMAKIGP